MKSYERPIRKNSKEAEFCRKFLKSLKIKYSFRWGQANPECWGWADGANQKIVVFPKAVIAINIDDIIHQLIPVSFAFHSRHLTVQEFLSTVFHEISHILAVRNKLFLHYNMGLKRRASRSYYHKWASEALKAERRADRDGKALMKQHFPDIPFIAHYNGKQGERMVRMMLDYAREELYERD